MPGFRFPMPFLLTVLTAAPSIHAADWTDEMVSRETIDFGVIATGSEARKQVKVSNVHDYPVRIERTSTTCGCSAASLGDKQLLMPGESTYVEVKMNTSKFRQKKESNLLIHLSRTKNTIVEVRIPIKAYIRTDVVLQPGSMNFEKVDAGKSKTAVVNINYAGRSDWAIEDVRFRRRDLKAVLSDPKVEDGLIKYKLTMTISENADVGRIRDLITLVTNDARNPFVPVMIEGEVISDIKHSPETLNVPSTPTGGTSKVQLVLTGKEPFLVEGISCDRMPNGFTATLPKTAKKVQILPITFNAPNRAARFKLELLVKIAGRPRPLRIPITGTITD